MITGTATDRVTEKGGVANGTAGAATASGNLNATDVDSAATFVVQSERGQAATARSRSMRRAPGPTRSTTTTTAVQALNTGGTLHELVTVKTADGTAQVIDVTINGANDAAVITGTATDRVTEKGGVANGTAGAATRAAISTRPTSTAAATFVAQTDVAGRATARSRSMPRAPGPTRSNDDNADVQALNTGDTLHELVTVATADGTSQVIDVTINGANDAAVISGTAARLGDRDERRRQRHGGRCDGERAISMRPTSTARRPSWRRATSPPDLRHVLDRCGRRLDLHAERRQRRRSRR